MLWQVMLGLPFLSVFIDAWYFVRNLLSYVFILFFSHIYLFDIKDGQIYSHLLIPTNESLVGYSIIYLRDYLYLALKIHLSEDTYKILKKIGGYNFICRGERQVKGRGLMTTYWLTGKDGHDYNLPSEDLALSASQHDFK